MKKLEDFLYTNATDYPNKVAILSGSNKITYLELYEKVCLQTQIYINASVRAIVEKSSQNIDFLIKYFAAHMSGKAFLPLEKDTPDRKLREVKDIVERNYIKSEIADILFTTGTTGKPKGVMISHEAILSNAENLIYAQEYSHATVFVISGPLNHIGSLSKVWPIIMLGGTIIITDGIKDMESFFSVFNYPSTKFALFLVPSSLRMLMGLGEKEFRKYSDRIDFIETGAAPISQNDMKRLCSVLPHTRLYNTYASTETGIIATHDFSKGECIPECLGKCMTNAHVLITQTGTIACKGTMIMSGYLGDEHLTKQVLLNGTVYTPDLGYLDEENRLFLKGRNDDVINIGGFKVSPVEVENIALAFEDIKECICISGSHPIMGNVLKLIYTTNNNQQIDKKSLIRHLKSNLELYKVPLLYEQANEIAHTYNGKIDRKVYQY